MENEKRFKGGNEMEKKLTFRGFDTQADAATFKKFLETHGFTGVMWNQKNGLWRVYFED